MIGLSVLDVLTSRISANQSLDFSFSIMGQHDDTYGLEMYGTFFDQSRLILYVFYRAHELHRVLCIAMS